MTKIPTLYYINQFVDTVQDAKTKAIETLVFDDKVAAPLKSFVEAQRTFTKEVNRSIVEFSDYLTVSAKAAYEKVSKAA
jgi:hypothetical protein